MVQQCAQYMVYVYMYGMSVIRAPLHRLCTVQYSSTYVEGRMRSFVPVHVLKRHPGAAS